MSFGNSLLDGDYDQLLSAAVQHKAGLKFLVTLENPNIDGTLQWELRLDPKTINSYIWIAPEIVVNSWQVWMSEAVNELAAMGGWNGEWYVTHALWITPEGSDHD